MRGLLVAAALLAPFPAQQLRAQCSDSLVRSAFKARLDADRAPVLVDTLLAGSEITVPMPTDPILLSECPSIFEDTVATPIAGDVTIEPVAGDLTFNDGGFDFRVVLDVRTEFDVDLQVCALPNTACQVNIDGESLEVAGQVQISAEDCSTDLEIISFEVTRLPAAEFELTGCGVLYNSIGETLFAWFEDEIFESVQEELESQIDGTASEWIDDGLERLATDGVEALGIRILASPEALSVTASEMELSFALGVESLITAPPWCELRPYTETPATSESLVLPDQGQAAFAVSRQAVESIVTAAWSAGWLCLDSRDLGLELGGVLDDLVSDVDISFFIDVPARPSVSLTGEDDLVLASLSIPELRIGVSTALPGDEPSLLTLSSGATLSAEIISDPADASFRLIPKDIVANGFELQSGAGPFALEPDRLERTIDILVLPALKDALEELSLSGTVFAGDDVATEVVELLVDDVGIGAGFEIYIASDDDSVAPETRMLSEPPTIVQPTFVVEMNSNDETPPERQVRHRVYVDGVEQDGLRVSRALELEIPAPGEHRVGIAAVDLAGNEDASPIEFDVFVDVEAPSISLVDPPQGIINERAVEIAYRLTDDVSALDALRVEYVVGEVAQTSEPDVRFAAGTLRAGAPLIVSNLTEDRAYRVTMTVIDEAGHQTEEQLSFAVNADPTFDCSSTAANPWLMILPLAVIAYRRKRVLLG
ncbi:MAG: hypothetical protein AAFQ82_13625 [Myxococcota bacterium]